jgi:two-component system response regulator ArlR
MAKQTNIIVFSSDQKVLKLLKGRLSWLGFNVLSYKDSQDFCSHFSYHPVDILVIDDSIKNVSVFSLLKKLRFFQIKSIILLTSNYSNLYQANFFGVTDILVKPFSLKSFDLKILAILNSKITYPLFTKFGAILYFYPYRKQIFLQTNNLFISLTNIEFRILSILINQRNQICNKSLFLENIWGYQDFWSLKSNLLEMHFCKLKKKLNFCFTNAIVLKKRNFFVFRL